MRADRVIELMKTYGVCPKCGNEKIGNGEGTISIGEKTFIRTCKCGWKIEIRFENE